MLQKCSSRLLQNRNPQGHTRGIIQSHFGEVGWVDKRTNTGIPGYGAKSGCKSINIYQICVAFKGPKLCALHLLRTILILGNENNR